MKEPGEVTFIGLDLAKTAGVAVLSEDQKECTVYEIVGTPYEQLYQIQNLVDGPAIWGIEELHIFRNAKTIRSLAERIGFLKWTIKGLFKEKCYMVSVSQARKNVGVKGKEAARELLQCQLTDGGRLTDNHSDAVLVALMVAKETMGAGPTTGLPTIKIGAKPQ